MLCGVVVWICGGLLSSCQAMLATMEESQHAAERQAQVDKEHAEAEVVGTIDKGKEAFVSQRFNDAKDSFEQAVIHYRKQEGNSNNLGKALNNLGAAYQELDQFERALDSYEKAESCLRGCIDGSDVRVELKVVLKNHAVLLRQLSRYSEAASMDDQADKL